jgi:signal transduction histidine kinase
MTQTKEKSNPVVRFFSAISRVDRLEIERARLQAFLSAFPGEYCGFSPDGIAVYSPGFCGILGLNSIGSTADIQATLSPSDAAAFEGVMSRLQEFGTSFVITAHNQDETKSFKISGSKGQDVSGTDHFFVLWVEDHTSAAQAQSVYAEEKQEIESQFKQIRIALDSIPRAVWLRDPQQNLVWVNTTYCNFLDMEMFEIIEQQKEIVSQAAKNKSGREHNREPGKSLALIALQSGTVEETQAHGVFHGKRLFLKISEIPLTSLGMTLGIAYNITKEEELEDELKRFKASTHELMEQLHSAIAIFNVEQALEFYNAAFAQLWNLDAGWLNRKPKLGEIMEKLRENRRLPEQSDFRAFKQSWLDMFTNLLKPSETMLYLPNNAALRMLAFPHTMGGLMMTFEDVSSRLELESSYNTLMAVQRETLDNLAEAVAVYGSDGRMRLYNPSFLRLWNLNPEDLENHPHISRIIEKKKPFFAEDRWQDIRESLIAKGLERHFSEDRIECISRKQKKMLIDVVTVPLPDGGVLTTFTNVTNKVVVEEALREKAKALEAAEDLKLDFLANVSYQLRTPLNAIMGFADILHQEYFGKLNKRQKEYTADIQQASETLLTLINDILDLSTLEAGYLELDRKEFDISAMLTVVEALISDWARKEKASVTVSYPADIGSMNGDERRIQQAIINVIRNALAYIKNDGVLNIVAERHKAEICFIIQDSQSALMKSQKTHIFKPFERAQAGNRKTDFSGTADSGLGLSLVRSIIQAHDGHVTMTSDENSGTVIKLSIPLISTKTSFKIPVG